MLSWGGDDTRLPLEKAQLEGQLIEKKNRPITFIVWVLRTQFIVLKIKVYEIELQR